MYLIALWPVLGVLVHWRRWTRVGSVGKRLDRVVVALVQPAHRTMDGSLRIKLDGGPPRYVLDAVSPL
jgi:hypothetical protein